LKVLAAHFSAMGASHNFFSISGAVNDSASREPNQSLSFTIGDLLGHNYATKFATIFSLVSNAHYTFN
jgi:hypothetical protein